MKSLIDTVKARLAVTHPPEQDYRMAFHLATTLERTPYTALAADAYASFGKAFAASGNPEVTQLAKVFESAARRLALIGKPMEVFGSTVEGKPINWKSYAGKVVLVDFWFTDCPPCRAEIPNVKRLYRLYHDRGFEVVGISVDESHEKLESFLHDEQIPWTNVFDTKTQDEHPLAEYYGIVTYPAVMLVGKDGKVLDLRRPGRAAGRMAHQIARSVGREAGRAQKREGADQRPS